MMADEANKILEYRNSVARQNHNKLNPEIKGFWEKQKERS